MSTIRGIDFILRDESGQILAGQKGATLNRSADTLETTTKDTLGWKTFITGLREWSIEAEGVFALPKSNGSNPMQILESAYMNNTPLVVQLALRDDDGLTVGDTVGYEGTVIITDFPIEAPQDAEVSFSVTLQGTGALIPVLKTI